MADTEKEKTQEVVKPTPTPTEPKIAPKQKMRLVLTGAGSYNDLNLKLGVLTKGSAIEVENDIAKKLLSTGLFQKA